MNSRHLATTLAALRYWQQDLTINEAPPISDHFDEQTTPLTSDEINHLCEVLNARSSITPERRAELYALAQAQRPDGVDLEEDPELMQISESDEANGCHVSAWLWITFDQEAQDHHP